MSVGQHDAEDPEEPDAAWRAATAARRVLLPLAQMEKKRRADVDAAAAALNISTTKAYRLIARLKEDERTSALLPAKSGRPAGLSMYAADIDEIIREVLERDYVAEQ